MSSVEEIAVGSTVGIIAGVSIASMMVLYLAAHPSVIIIFGLIGCGTIPYLNYLSQNYERREKSS